jgi:hypothetical protein
MVLVLFRLDYFSTDGWLKDKVAGCGLGRSFLFWAGTHAYQFVNYALLVNVKPGVGVSVVADLNLVRKIFAAIGTVVSPIAVVVLAADVNENLPILCFLVVLRTERRPRRESPLRGYRCRPWSNNLHNFVNYGVSRRRIAYMEFNSVS